MNDQDLALMYYASCICKNRDVGSCGMRCVISNNPLIFFTDLKYSL